jgi:arsenate reductase (glutaredoxin)
MSVRIYGIRKRAGVPPGKLSAWTKRAGWEKVANMCGPTWRKIPDSQKATLDAANAIRLLEANSSAIKRPIVEAGERLLIGFDPAEFETLR